MNLLNLLLKETLGTRLAQPNVIASIIIAGLGIATVLLAYRFARFIRKTDKIDSKDRIVENMRIIGLLLIVVALVVMIID